MNGLFPEAALAFHPAPAIPAGFPANLMAVQYGRPRYALDEQGRLIGLNLAAPGAGGQPVEGRSRVAGAGGGEVAGFECAGE